MSVEDVAATLRYLVPGFVALKTFSIAGLQSRRTDLELTFWSLLAAAAINTVIDRFGLDTTSHLVAALIGAVVIGLVGGAAWNAVARHFPSVRVRASRRAWDSVLDRRGDEAPWIQVWTRVGHVIAGWPYTMAISAEADELDLYLRDPAWVNVETNERTPMGIEGVLILESDIAFIQVLET